MYLRSLLTDCGVLPLYGSIWRVSLIPCERAASSKTGMTGSGGGPSSSARPAGYQETTITPTPANWSCVMCVAITSGSLEL